MADEPPEGRDDPDEPRTRPDDPDDERPADGVPLGDLADRVRRRRAGEGDGRDVAPDAVEGEGRFVPADAVDPAASDRLRGSADPAPPAGAVEAEGAADEHVVPKRQYCESCEHLGEPPAVRCEHPGTTIVEFVDADHVRVRSCPVVAERRAAGESDREPGQHPGPFGGR